MEQLKQMKETLMSCVQSQIYSNLDKVDTKELGEAIDMIKDLSEAIYYCTITEAMEEGVEEEEERGRHGTMYSTRVAPMPEPHVKNMRPMYAKSVPHTGPMYKGYSDGMVIHPYNPSYGDGEWERMPMYERDLREGRSGERRKMYMEGKGSRDKTAQMKELENYMQELSTDITEMIADASLEEKQILQ
jgi:hypothetical protein